MEKNRVLFVKLYPEISNLTRENPPIASFIIRVVSSAGDRKALTHPGSKLKLYLQFLDTFLFITCFSPMKMEHVQLTILNFILLTLDLNSKL